MGSLISMIYQHDSSRGMEVFGKKRNRKVKVKMKQTVKS